MSIEDGNHLDEEPNSNETNKPEASRYSFFHPVKRKLITTEIPFSRNVARLLEEIANDRASADFQNAVTLGSGPVRDLSGAWPIPWGGPAIAEMSKKDMLEKITLAKQKIQQTKEKLEAVDQKAGIVLDRILVKLNLLMSELVGE